MMELSKGFVKFLSRTAASLTLGSAFFLGGHANAFFRATPVPYNCKISMVGIIEPKEELVEPVSVEAPSSFEAERKAKSEIGVQSYPRSKFHYVHDNQGKQFRLTGIRCERTSE